MSSKSYILIAEPSEVIREGLFRIITSLNNSFEPVLATCFDDLKTCNEKSEICIVLLNPALLINQENQFSKLKTEFEKAKWIGINTFYGTLNQSDQFDDSITLNDSSESILNTIEKHLNKSEEATNGNPAILSEREIDVLKLIIKGQTNNEIAKELFISIHTVNSHRKNITQKLGIKSAAGLAMYAVVNNIIEMGDYLK